MTAAFVIAGAAWVLLTDTVLYSLTHDRALVARLETAKGWAFVAVTSVLLYAVTLRSASRVTHAQALVSAVVESIADGVLLLGRDRRILHANPAALRMLHLEDARDLVGIGAREFSRRFRVSYPDGSLVPPERLVSQRVFIEGGPLRYKAVLYPPGGSELVISATAAAVRDEVGEPAKLVVSVMHDITNEENFERLRDEFFAGAAHALKTPVAVIKANAHVLAEDSPPRGARAAAAVNRQCERIDRLVQNLLVLSRARSRTLKLFIEELELPPLVERVARDMTALSRGHELRTDLSETPRVHADRERLEIVLRNLVDQAIRRSPSGSSVTILLRPHGEDAGIGVRYTPLPPEELHVHAHGEHDDVGIGRCMATLIIDSHGGALREERDGIETTEWIELPASQEAHGHV